MREGFLPRVAAPIHANAGRSTLRAMIPASQRRPEVALHAPPGAAARRATPLRPILRNGPAEAYAASGPRPFRLAARSCPPDSGWPARRGRSRADLSPFRAARSMPDRRRARRGANRRPSTALPVSGRAARTLWRPRNRRAPPARPHRRIELARRGSIAQRDRTGGRMDRRRDRDQAATAAHAPR